LVDGVLIRPNQFAGALTAIPPIASATWLWVVLLPLLVYVAHTFTRWTPTPTRRIVSAVVRGVAALLLLATTVAPALDFPGGLHFGWMVAVLPVVALVLVPRVGSTNLPRLGTRRLLAALSVAHSLHAFPVAGLQAALASALPVVCAAVLLDDCGR